MVPTPRRLTARRATPRRESELAPAVRAHLESEGYRVWVDPDGSDYFDVVARRGATIALVELKLTDGRRVLEQALRRRGWADQVSVAVARESVARRILERPVAERGRRIGIWWIDDGRVRVLRAAEPLVRPGEPDPFEALRAELGERLDLLESGALVPGVSWSLAAAARRAPSGPRGTKEWRLEEFSDPVTEASGRETAQSAPPSERS